MQEKLEKPRVLATICARGGSKGVPLKNIRELKGKPLLAYTLACARDCRAVDRFIVSTDSPEIADIARSLGAPVPFMRPPDLGRDNSAKVGAIRHATG